MSHNIPLLNKCLCLSLKTGTIVLGSLELFLNILYFVDTFIYRLSMSIGKTDERYLIWITDVVFEYAKTIQLIFSSVLIYGALKEKSGFVAAWLLKELAAFVDGVWNMVLISFWYFHLGYVIEQFIIMGLSILMLWVVYSFYCSMPKTKYIL